MRNLFVLFVLFLVLLNSCGDKKENATFDGKPVLTKEEALKTLNTLAFELASDRSWITMNNIETLQKTGLQANELPIKSETPVSFYLKEGSNVLTEYDVVIELNGPNGLEKLQKSSGNEAYRVALDPDQFYLIEDPAEEDWTSRPTLQLPTYYYTGNEASPVEETITFGSGIQLTDPIFFITLNETTDNLVHKSAVIPGVYLAFFGLDLRYDTDDGNEEFELFLSNGPNELTNPFNPSTTHMFNGSARDDASGLSRNYPDINYIANGWNVDTSQSIALRVFDGATFRLTPIEDDYSAGNYCRNGLNVGQTSDHNVDYYDMSDNYVKFGINSRFQTGVNGLFHNSDDRIGSAGVKNITSDNVSARMGANLYMNTDQTPGSKLYHVNWRLGVVTRN